MARANQFGTRRKLIEDFRTPFVLAMCSFILALLYFLGVLSFTDSVLAQVEPPSKTEVFRGDETRHQEAHETEVAKSLETSGALSKDFDINAPSIDFLQDPDRVKASGGVLISGQGIQFQADQALLETETKDAELKGHVLLTESDVSISAERAEINLESETGTFFDSELVVEEGGYSVRCEEMRRVSEYSYQLADSIFTTCGCADDAEPSTPPWQISGSKADITEGGYAFVEDMVLRADGVPIFYSPWFVFPVKEERSSGLLVPQYGYSSEDGVLLELPVFVAVDDFTDFTVAPFIQTQTRYGTEFELEKVFSKRSRVKGGFIYSNERRRDGDLRGTITSNVFDPEIEDDRLGVFYKQQWRSDSGADIPLNFVADIHYIGDDLMLRELQDERLGRYNARYTTSQVLMGAYFDQYTSAELSGEYNQSIDSDDDLTFQRLPSGSATYLRSFRPFGFNPYGLKVTTNTKVEAVDFVRDSGYDGWRYDLRPSIKIPFHYKNYFAASINADYRHTVYELRDASQPGSGAVLNDSNDRGIYTLGGEIGTVLERVFDLSDDNFLTTLTGLGQRNQALYLRRLKHTIEPSVQYVYVPDEAQDDLPRFDSLDRIRARSLFTYGVKTRLLGRFIPTLQSQETIPELAPRVQDLPMLGFNEPLADYGTTPNFANLGTNVDVRDGEIREIASFAVRQSYDYIEDQEDNDPARSPWSDVGADLVVSPSSSFAIKYETNYDAEDRQVSSWGISTHFFDDRGDVLRARYSFIDDNVSQIEGNIELVLTERFKLGYYGRYDDLDHEFIENRGALRFESGCGCWKIDFGYRDQINPDRQAFLLTVTLTGLGDLTQDFRFGDDDRQA